MKEVFQAVRIFIVLTILTGVIYPWMVTTSAQIHFHDQAEGSFIYKGSKPIGSELIAQSFEQNRYFWPRPSAVQYNPLPSGGSNLSPASEGLRKAVRENQQRFGKNAPDDLIFSSGSGLDPHISPEAALFQVDRVAAARHLSQNAVKSVVLAHIEEPTFGILGQRRVNVLLLNKALDEP